MVGTRTRTTRRRSARFAGRYTVTESSRRPALGRITAHNGSYRRPTEMSDRNFFSELKRRNVYKVAVAYVVVAWLIIQAASILLPTFDAPAWAMKVIVRLLVLGFPVAL